MSDTDRSAVILLGHERAGTHLLKSLLGSHPAIQCTGEVCKITSADERSAKTNYFNHRLRMIQTDERFAFPLLTNQRDLLTSYFDELQEVYRKASRVIIDVKYSHVHNFNSFWTSNSISPYLFQFAGEFGIKIMHLHRQKALLAVLSNELAGARQLWNTADRNELEDREITVKPAYVLKECRKLTEWQREMSRHCKPLKGLELRYEQLLTEGKLDPRVSSEIARFLEVEEDWQSIPALVKVSPHPEKFVKNLDELEAFFRNAGAEHLWQL